MFDAEVVGVTIGTSLPGRFLLCFMELNVSWPPSDEVDCIFILFCLLGLTLVFTILFYIFFFSSLVFDLVSYDGEMVAVDLNAINTQIKLLSRD